MLKFKTIIVILLSLWCLFNIYDIWTVGNNYELLVGFIFFLLPTIVVLLLLSFNLRKENHKLEKIIAMIGIIVGVLSIIMSLLTYGWNLIR